MQKFSQFRDRLLVELAKVEEAGSPNHQDLKVVADNAGLLYRKGWVGKAAVQFDEGGYIDAAFSLGGPDENYDAMLRAEGLERAEEILEEWGEAEDRGGQTGEFPASDRYVTIDHNSTAYQEMRASIEAVKEAILTNNEYGASNPEDREQRIAELEAGLRLTESSRVRPAAFWTIVGGALYILGQRFVDTATGDLVTAAWTAVKAFVGF